jgi:ribosomal protein S18 acetylase RimI-like enzyme
MQSGSADRGPGIAPRVTIEIRNGDCSDREYIADLAKRTVRTSVAPFRHPPKDALERSLARLLQAVEEQPHVTLVAEYDARRAGFILLIDGLPDEMTAVPQGFIAYMAVEPALQRRGIGTALLSAAESEAKRRGLPYMTLMVTEGNVAAQALYERGGYVTERRLLCKPL